MEELLGLTKDDFLEIASTSSESEAEEAACTGVVRRNVSAGQANVIKPRETVPPCPPTAPQSIALDKLLDSNFRPIFRPRTNVSDTAARVRCCVSALLSKNGCSKKAAAQALQLKRTLTRNSFAILTSIPTDVLDVLQKAEAATAQFFAIPLADKQMFEWSASRHASKHKNLHLCGTGYTRRMLGRGRVQREQYHMVVGAWKQCFGKALFCSSRSGSSCIGRCDGNNSGSGLAASLSENLKMQESLLPALLWYQSFCLFAAELMLPGLAQTLAEKIVETDDSTDPSVFDAFLYPNRASDIQHLSHNMDEHFDPGFFTATLVSTVPGLSVLDTATQEWVAVEQQADAATDIVIFSCEALERLTKQAVQNSPSDRSTNSDGEEQQGQQGQQQQEYSARVLASELFSPALPRAVHLDLDASECCVAVVEAANHKVDKQLTGDNEDGDPRLSLVYELRSWHNGL